MAPKVYPNMWGDSGKAVIQKNKAESVEQEKRWAKMLGMRLQPGSGNSRWRSQKNDLVDRVFMPELKKKAKDGLKLTPRLLVKALSAARDVGKVGFLGVTLEGMPRSYPEDFVVIPAETFAIMLDLLYDKLPEIFGETDGTETKSKTKVAE